MQEINWHHHERVKAGEDIGCEILSLSLRIIDIHMCSFEKAYRELIKRHEGLRTTFEKEDGKIWQVIHAYKSDIYDTDVYDISLCLEQSEFFQTKMEEVTNKLTDLRSGPLIKSLLFKVGPNEHCLVIVLHHIICDATSLGTLKSEFSKFYRYFKYGEEYSLSPICMINDILVRQQTFLKGKNKISELRYWIQKLQKHYGSPVFQDSRRATGPSSNDFRTFWFVLEETEHRHLNRLARYCNVSLFAALLASLHLLLYKQFRIRDLLTAATINDRKQESERCLIGHLAHKIYLSNQPKDDQPIYKYVQSVYLELIRSCRHPMYNERQFDRHNLADYTALYVNHLKSDNSRATSVGNRACKHECANPSSYPLSCFVGEGKDFLHCEWLYNANFLTSMAIDDLSGFLPRVISLAGSQPEKPVKFVTI